MGDIIEMCDMKLEFLQNRRDLGGLTGRGEDGGKGKIIATEEDSPYFFHSRIFNSIEIANYMYSQIARKIINWDKLQIGFEISVCCLKQQVYNDIFE